LGRREKESDKEKVETERTKVKVKGEGVPIADLGKKEGALFPRGESLWEGRQNGQRS